MLTITENPTEKKFWKASARSGSSATVRASKSAVGHPWPGSHVRGAAAACAFSASSSCEVFPAPLQFARLSSSFCRSPCGGSSGRSHG
jgi:hypothetical protein